MPGTLDPPFGTHALPRALESLRRIGGGFGTGGVARRVASLTRRLCMAGRPDPFDVEPFPGQRARLYPRDNLSEKRVFGAPQFWDGPERAALAEAARGTARPFHFVDAGANVGLYSLFVRSLGPARILAIEPEPGTLVRLRANLAASGADDVAVAPVALAAEESRAHIAVTGDNRGEATLGETGNEVTTRPLLDVVREGGFARIDALKMDIEGREAPVLEAFFATAPSALWPAMVLLEAPRGEATEALALLIYRGYLVTRRTRLNAILVAPDGRLGAATGTTTRNMDPTDG